MPSVAACDAAGAISATAHAASRVVLIRIRAPGEEFESREIVACATTPGWRGAPRIVVRPARERGVRISDPRIALRARGGIGAPWERRGGGGARGGAAGGGGGGPRRGGWVAGRRGGGRGGGGRRGPPADAAAD